MSNFDKFLDESSLSRLWEHNRKYDCAALTAFRGSRDCGRGDIYTKNENRQRNRSLLAKLKSKGYGVTSLHGVYPEGGREGKEESFFVVNLPIDKNFIHIITDLGEEFDQDSVLIVPKGSVEDKDQAYLIGTNHCENNWLGYHKHNPFERGKFGFKSPIYTSYVNGRPFLFEDIGNEILNPGNGMGWWALNIIVKKHWSEIEL